MTKQKTPFVFDAEAALKAATLAVIGLSSAWKYNLSEADRKEIIAESVAKAWSRRDTFNPAKASFRTWVGCIARNTLLDHIRRHKNNGDSPARSQESMTAKAPDTLMAEDEGLETIMKAISELPESHRLIVTLLSEGKGPQDIAEILGCSANAATIRCSRARKALREKLSENA